MPYPLRSTVGAAVLAGALVFSGAAANAQPLADDDSVVTAPFEQGTPDAGESAPVVEQGEAPLLPELPVEETARNGAAEEPTAGTPDADIDADADAPGGDATTGPADTEELPPAGAGEETDAPAIPETDGLPAGAEAPMENPAVAPADAPAETLVEKVLPLTEKTAPPTVAKAPAAPSATGVVSHPAATVVTAPDAGEEAETDAEPAASLPVSGLFKFPEGAADWTEGQWNEWMVSGESGQWLEDNAESFVQLVESEDYADFRDTIFPYFVEGTPEELFAYLEATYPDDLLMAQFMVGVVMGELIEEGVLDENGSFIGELFPETDEPTDKPAKEPTKESAGESAEKR
ncbi:hypothetical protein [Paeniglutamicibacter kerguelensis]|uniref:hypothetical protein n=1 Tax=Paeniglutamicibacter kerguelensis TaxID=254788 RepID=UPI003617941B